MVRADVAFHRQTVWKITSYMKQIGIFAESGLKRNPNKMKDKN